MVNLGIGGLTRDHWYIVRRAFSKTAGWVLDAKVEIITLMERSLLVKALFFPPIF